MADESKHKPDVSDGVTDHAEAVQRKRAERLAGALRNNLRRRNPTERKISERPGVAGVHAKDQTEDQDKDG